MNFDSARNDAVDWLKLQPNFELIECDENESRLQFACKKSQLCSFFLICSTGEKANWEIKSDVPQVLPHLAAARRLCAGQQDIAIKDVLDCLVKELPADSESDSEDEEDNMSDADYYSGFARDDEDDADAVGDGCDEAKAALSKDNEEVDEAYQRFSSSGNPLAVKRLIKDMVNLEKSGGKFGISGSPRGDNLFIWDVQLTDIPEESKLGRDLAAYAKKYKTQPNIQLEMVFPGDFPCLRRLCA